MIFGGANGLYQTNPKLVLFVKWRMYQMSTEPFHVTDQNFEETLKKNKLVFVDFWAAWCGPCRALAPTIVELANEYSGKVLIGKLDVDENPATAERFQVFSIPTMIVFKDGKEAERLVGLCPKNRIVDALMKHQ
jgi:thioredoxin 1